jgi:hypothetical protein
MANYLLAYHGGGMAATEAERKKSMDAWGAWFGRLGAAVVDAGNPTAKARTIGKGGAVSDGGGSNPVTGYSVIKADSLDAAIQLAKSCPIIQDGGSVELCETFSAM